MPSIPEWVIRAVLALATALLSFPYLRRRLFLHDYLGGTWSGTLLAWSDTQPAAPTFALECELVISKPPKNEQCSGWLVYKKCKGSIGITEGVDRLAVIENDSSWWGAGFYGKLFFRGYLIEDHLKGSVEKSERLYQHTVAITFLGRLSGRQLKVVTTAPCGTVFRGELHRR